LLSLLFQLHSRVVEQGLARLHKDYTFHVQQGIY